MADAGGAVIGALRVVLGADTANFDKGLKDAQGGMTSFVRNVTTIAAGIGLERILEGFVNSAVNSVKHAITLGDELNKMSQKAGVSVEELSKLKYAADLSDVSTETLGKSMGKLSRTLVEAATDGASQAGRAFAQMGITIKDVNTGHLRPTIQILGDVADKFASYKDGAEKTALSMAVFGRAGAEVIPLLNLSKAGLKEAADEAEKFGLVIGKQSAMAAEQFQDNLKRLDSARQGLFIGIAEELLPTLVNLTNQLVQNKKESTLAADAANFVGQAVRFLYGEITILIEKFRGAGREAAAFWAVMTAMSLDDIRTAWNRWGLVVEENENRLKELTVHLSSVKDAFDSGSFVNRFTTATMAIEAATKETKRLQEEQKKTTAPAVGDMAGQKDALDKFLETKNKQVASMRAEAETVGQTAAQQVYLKTVYEAQAIALNNNIPLTAALNAQITQAGQNAAAAAMQIQAANIAQQVRTPAQKYADELRDLQIVYETTSMTAETFALKQQQLAEGVGATWQQAGAGIASGFSQLAAQFGKSSKEMATTAKVFAIVEATINTYTAFTKALAASPPPFNYVMAAGVLAAGMAKVMAIKSQSVGGFKTGGSFMVGGSGGQDSQLVPIRATPGERVDVWRPGEGPDPRMGARNGMQGGTQIIELRGLSAGQRITFDEGVRMLEAINDVIQFGGYKIKVAAT